MDLIARLVVAARLELSHTSKEAQMLLVGRALLPDGFLQLQTKPLFLPPYVAARVILAAAFTRQQTRVSDLISPLNTFVTSSFFTAPKGLERLQALLIRAGLTKDKASATALSIVWSANEKALLLETIPRTPYLALMNAILHEVCEVRRKTRDVRKPNIYTV